MKKKKKITESQLGRKTNHCKTKVKRGRIGFRMKKKDRTDDKKKKKEKGRASLCWRQA